MLRPSSPPQKFAGKMRILGDPGLSHGRITGHAPGEGKGRKRVGRSAEGETRTPLPLYPLANLWDTALAIVERPERIVIPSPVERDALLPKADVPPIPNHEMVDNRDSHDSSCTA